MIQIELVKGTYVLAVSGGVDSVALLHLVATQPEYKSHTFIVAHFDHGIRSDSSLDRQLVQDSAKKYSLQFVYNIAKLGAGASEEQARKERYKFLHTVRRACNADAIVTAHHQDDRIETAFINIQRGTGRRGITSLRSTNDIVRPMLHISKKQIIDYAQSQNLTWREDSTNDDTKYVRNHLRKNILPKLTRTQRKDFLDLLDRTQLINDDIDAMMINIIHANSPRPGALSRHILYMLDHEEACELLATWLRCNNVRRFNKKNIEQLVVYGKTLPRGVVAISDAKKVTIQRRTLALEPLDR